MSCPDGCCELHVKARRHVRRSARQEKYGRLWAEVELPEELLGDMTRKTAEDQHEEHKGLNYK
jgi:hypothetical protein